MELTFDYAQTRDHAVEALRQRFPNAAITAEEGWHGRVHIKIVSPEFDNLTGRQSQAAVWDVLRERLREEAQGVSLVLALGMDEL